MRARLVFAFALGLVGCQAAPVAMPVVADAIAPSGPIRTGEIMVAWAQAPDAAELAACAALVGGTAGETVADRALLKVPAGAERAASRTLAARAGVTAAEPNRIVKTHEVKGSFRLATDRSLQAFTNDGVFTAPSAVFAGQPDGWGLRAVNADKAWEVSSGDPGIVIAIIDTGVDLAHPDLQPNLVTGRNFVEPGQPPDDDFGHGTHVAGIAAAAGNGGGAAVGLAYSSKIMPLRVLGVDGSGSTWDTVAAIDHAVARGAAVINLSLGSPSYSQIEADAIRKATEAGTLVVAAAGNEAQDGNYIEYPASYPNVVSVAATGFDSRRAPFSNFNSWVTIAAPGVDIFSTVPTRMAPTKPYGFLSGTSMASPMVAGAAALVFATHPTWTPAQVTQQLRRTARDLTPYNGDIQGYDVFFGSGLLDAGRAMGRQ